METHAQNVLDALLRRSLFASAEPLPQGETDWTEVFDEAVAQTVVAVAFDGIPKGEEIPEEVYKRFRSAAMAVAFKQSIFSAAVSALDRVLTRAEIKYAVIKGLANAAFYPKPELRMQGDIDFLVSFADTERAKTVLLESGFTELESGSDFHLRFAYGGTELEMHRTIGGIPDTANGREFEKQLLDGLNSPQRIEMGVCSFFALQPQLELIVTLVHMHDHLMSTSTSLRHLCDFALISRVAAEATLPLLESLHICKAYYIYTTISHQLFGTEPPSTKVHADFDENDIKTVLDYFRNGGHFGRKYDGFQGGTLVTGSNSHSFSGSLSEYTKNNFPLCRKHPVLLPLGFIVCCVKYLLLIVSGKRKAFNPRAVAKNFDDKTRIIEKIDIFSDTDIS